MHAKRDPRGRAASVPMVRLGALIEECRSGWELRLARLFARDQFILGEEVAEFEREFARYLGARQAVGTGSGTAALELCLRAAPLRPERNEVLTSALSSPFTAHAIRSAGGSPRFADVDPDTLLMDPEDAAGRLTSKTGAIIPVHLYGQPCALDRFRRIAKDAAASLVQDACQAHGARFRGRPLTDFSNFVAYSFYPTKNLPCLGDGGAVATNSAAVARRLRLLRDGGRRNDQVSRLPAINSRLDEMQACFLRSFLPRLNAWNQHRIRLAELYEEALKDVPGIRLLRRSPGSVVHLFVIRAQRRNRLRALLASRGISTGIHYPVPLHLQPAFRDCGARKGDLPHAEQACQEIVSLPLHPHLGEDAVLRVCEAVREFYHPVKRG